MGKKHSSNLLNQYMLGLISLLLISALILTSTPVNAYHMSSLDKAADQHSNAPFALAATQLLPPTNLVAEEVGDKTVVLTWQASSGAVKYYNIYRSDTQSSYEAGDLIKPLVVTNPYMKMEYTDKISDLEIIKEFYYVVTAVDSQGVESDLSNEVVAIPHHEIFWVGTVLPLGRSVVNENQIDPYTLGDPSIMVSFDGEIDIPGHTNGETPLPDVWAQLGFGPAGDDPSSTDLIDLSLWTNWIDADFAGPGKYDPIVIHSRYTASLIPDTPGKYYFTYRFSTDGGRSWVYSDMDTTVLDPKGDPGKIVPGNKLWYMVVNKGSDVEPPHSLPTWKLPVIGKTSVKLSWNPSTDPDIYAYDLYRSTSSSFQGEQVKVKRILSTESYQFTDTGLTANSQYYYRITAYDKGFNPSVSKILNVKTLPSVVTVRIHVSIPRFTKGTIYINRKIDPVSFLPGGTDWKGTPVVPCDFTKYICDLTLKLQENSQFKFLFSRGSAQTVQTQSDGNTPPIDPSFTVKAGMGTINRVISNWDDPIAVASQPTGTRVPLDSQVSVTWNQVMPNDTVFALYETGTSKIVPGTFLNDPAAFTTTFIPDTTLYPSRYYTIETKGQQDTKSILQLGSTKWDFLTDKQRLHFPLIFKQ